MNLSPVLIAIGISLFTINTHAKQFFNEKSKKNKQENKKFIDPSNMDFSVRPGDDFYKYASGNWLKNNPVPAKETSWGSFMELSDFNINAVKSILTKAEANKNAAPGSIEKRVGDFYAAAMDTVAIEKLGYSPIKPDLERINSIKNLNEILNEIALMKTTGLGSPFFIFFIDQDSKNPQKIISQLYQGGTSLPDRDYYLKDDERTLKIRAAYNDYIVQLFSLIGDSKEEATNKATIIYDIEKQLAKAQLSRVELRDPYKTYNKFAINDFSKTTPHINWQQFMQKLLVKGEDTLLVSHPPFFKTVDSVLANTPINQLKVYLKWNLLKSSASHLSSAFVNASFKYSQALSGQKVQTPRWQRMSALTDLSLIHI